MLPSKVHPTHPGPRLVAARNLAWRPQAAAASRSLSATLILWPELQWSAHDPAPAQLVDMAAYEA
jgi:hypothetical protein